MAHVAASSYAIEVMGAAIQTTPKRLHVRVYAELNDLVDPERRGRTSVYEFSGTPSIKDVIEALGIPHTEVELVLADGESVDLSWRARDGVRVSLFPVFESLDISPVARVRPVPLRTMRFVLDVHLGRLARYLRMLGFDAAWSRDADDDQLVRVSADEHRVLLTRDRGVLKRRAVTHGCLLHASDPARQLREVVQRLDLARSFRPFTRCMRCNGALVTVPKETVRDEVPRGVLERHDAFRRCERCGRVYWAGSHHARMQRMMTTWAGE